jgi:L-threonylcarbamoyladenylate synthase
MKPQKYLHLDTATVDKAVSLWRVGKLVAIPTETVYGLAADATNAHAVAGIYALKSRPQFNPLIVHVTGAPMAKRYVQWNAHAEMLSTKFWPGPLTLVLKRTQNCPISDLVSAGGDTLAVRCPAHPIAQQLLAAFDGALAAPSANRSGRVSPTMAAHVQSEFGGDVLVIDGGACEVGLESTVIDLTGSTPAILRPGSITRAMIEEVLSAQPSLVSDSSPLATLKSPGQLASHYAPGIPVRLNAREVKSDEALLAFGTPITGAAKTLNLSPNSDLIEAAANLFAHLRALDDARFRAIAVMPIPHDGIGEAINDRLSRAAT